MPRGNFYGPMGMGPMSGRGAGFCAGYDTPGFAYPGYPMRGMRRGRHGHGRFGRHGMMPMHPYGWGAMDFAAFPVPHPSEMTTEEKADMLSTREAWLQEQLDEVRTELESLEKEAQKKTEKKEKSDK